MPKRQRSVSTASPLYVLKKACLGDHAYYADLDKVFRIVVQVGMLLMLDVCVLSRTRKSLSSLLSASVLPRTLSFQKFGLCEKFKTKVNALQTQGKQIRISPFSNMKIAGLDLKSLGFVISFRDHTSVFNDTLWSLQGFTQVDAVLASSLYTTGRVTDNALEVFSSLKVHALDLYNSPKLTTNGLKYIDGEHLRALDLGLNRRITGLPFNLVNLTHLSLMYCTSIEDWSFLLNLNCLVYLDAGYTSIDLQYLSGSKALTELHLNSCYNINPDALLSLQDMMKLRVLNFIKASITSACVASLEALKLPSLASLLLSDCAEVDDECLPSLVNIAQTSPLRELDLCFCRGFTKHRIKLSGLQDLPGVKITLP